MAATGEGRGFDLVAALVGERLIGSATAQAAALVEPRAPAGIDQARRAFLAIG